MKMLRSQQKKEGGMVETKWIAITADTSKQNKICKMNNNLRNLTLLKFWKTTMSKAPKPSSSIFQIY